MAHLLDLQDFGRHRPIPVAHYPAQGERLGWLLFSVGFGGERSGYAFLGRCWSARGFDVAVVEHVGSNLEVLRRLRRPGMRQSELAVVVGQQARNGEEMRHRVEDLQEVRRQLCGLNDWVGVAGHSLGSTTALGVLGAELRLESGPWLPPQGPGWQAAVLLSVQPPGSMVTIEGWRAVEVPCLLITGTLDHGMPAGVEVEGRLRAYQYLRPGLRWQALLEGADHMALAGVGLRVAPIVTTLEHISGEFWVAQREGRCPRWSTSYPQNVEFTLESFSGQESA